MANMGKVRSNLVTPKWDHDSLGKVYLPGFWTWHTGFKETCLPFSSLTAMANVLPPSCKLTSLVIVRHTTVFIQVIRSSHWQLLHINNESTWLNTLTPIKIRIKQYPSLPRTAQFLKDQVLNDAFNQIKAKIVWKPYFMRSYKMPTPSSHE